MNLPAIERDEWFKFMIEKHDNESGKETYRQELI